MKLFHDFCQYNTVQGETKMINSKIAKVYYIKINYIILNLKYIISSDSLKPREIENTNSNKW